MRKSCSTLRTLPMPTTFAIANEILRLKASGQSYKQFTLVIYNSRVVIWGNFKSGTTLES